MIDISSALKKAQDHLASWLLPLLGTALSGVVLWAESYLARQVSDPTDIWLIRAISVSVLLLFLLAGSYFWFKPKFKHIPSLGVHENIKTKNYYCTSCLIKEKRQSPLLTQNNGWRCLVQGCGMFYHNPDYIEPPIPKVKSERI